MHYFEFYFACPRELSASFLWWRYWLLVTSVCQSLSLRPFNPHMEAESVLNPRPWVGVIGLKDLLIQRTFCTSALVTGFLFARLGAKIWLSLSRSSDLPGSPLPASPSLNQGLLLHVLTPWSNLTFGQTMHLLSMTCQGQGHPLGVMQKLLNAKCYLAQQLPPFTPDGMLCLPRWPSFHCLLPDRKLLTRWVGLTSFISSKHLNLTPTALRVLMISAHSSILSRLSFQ